MQEFKYILLFICISFAYTNGLYSQNTGDCKGSKNKKAEKLFLEAEKKNTYSNYVAIDMLNQAVELDPKYTQALFLLGKLYFQNSIDPKTEPGKKEYLYSESKKFLNKAIKLCPQINNFESYFLLGKIAYYQKKFAEAQKNLEFYNKESTLFINKLEAESILNNIAEYNDLISNPIEFLPYSLPGINTDFDEYLPAISPDGETMFFTRRIYIDQDDFVEKFMMSKRMNTETGERELFSDGYELKAPFNDGRNQGGSSITADGKNLFISICGIEKGQYASYKNCDIYQSVKNQDGWGPLNKLNSNINGSYSFEAQPSISASGKILYFASIRDGGYGGIDIYKSEKDINGNWGEAVNLGPTINTDKDDKTPFIHPDEKTLFFCSDGRNGVGGFDIFFSKYEKNTGWSNPQNLGYPINTADDEVSFTIKTDGEKIYFSSKNLVRNKNYDIFSNPLPQKAKPEKVLLVKGKVKGADGDTISEVKVQLTSTSTKKQTEGTVDYTGDYTVTVPVGKEEKFILTASKHGYIYFSELIDPTKKEYIPPTYKDLIVEKIQKKKAYRLKNVNFEFDSYELSEECEIELDELFVFMNDHPAYYLQILGHTDNEGTPNHNLELSQNRAKAVTDYLLKKGISSERLEYKYFGETKALVSNSTEAGRAVNRRVEFVILR